MFVLQAVGSLGAAPLLLEVSPHVTVRGNTVLVSDVAQVISGTPATGLLEVQLGRTPAPGQTLRLSRARVRGTLAARGFDVEFVRVRGARAVVVSPAVTRLAPTALRSMAARFVAKELSSRYHVAAEARVATLKAPWVVPVGRRSSGLHVRWLIQPGNTPPRHAHLEAVVTLDGEERASLRLEVEILLPRPVAQPKQVPAAHPAERRLGSPGQDAKPFLVTADQRVQTRVQIGGLTVLSAGFAMGNAGLDQPVGVRTASGQLREGRVVAPGVVEVTGQGGDQ